MTLKELRKAKGITQKQAADFVGVPLRTYQVFCKLLLFVWVLCKRESDAN